MKMNSVWATLFATLLAVPAAYANVIFDNGDFVDDFAGLSDLGDDYSRFSSFVLKDGLSTITDIHWWGVYFSGNTPQASDAFNIVIYSDDGGLPGSLVALYDVGHVGRTDTGNDFVDFHDIYSYSVDIAPLALSANTTYWLGIINDTTSDDDDNWAWMWSNSSNGSIGVTYWISGESWLADVGDTAFLLTNDNIVPEPATVSLLGLGIAGLAMRRREQH